VGEDRATLPPVSTADKPRTQKTVSQNGRPGIGHAIGTKTEPTRCDTERSWP